MPLQPRQHPDKADMTAPHDKQAEDPTRPRRCGTLQPPLLAGLLLAVAACSATPMRWQKPGVVDASKDEAECGTAAHEQAINQLPYGNGPPLYGLYSRVSMLQWTNAIDNERYYLERDLTRQCMLNKGFLLVPTSGPTEQ